MSEPKISTSSIARSYPPPASTTEAKRDESIVPSMRTRSVSKRYCFITGTKRPSVASR